MYRIAVTGCGIAGSTVAYLLAQRGHRVTVLEQAETCRPIGAGIMIQTSGQQVLQRMGLLEGLLPLSARLDGMTADLVSGRRLIRLDFQRLNSKCYALGVHRGTLFDLLLNCCRESGVEIVNGFRAIRFDSHQGRICSSDGRSFGEFDFLIVADGSRSELRNSLGISASITEYAHGALWATGPCDYQPDRLFQVVDGTHRLIGLLPIGRGASSYFWGLPNASWPTLATADFNQWREQAIELCPPSASLLKQLSGFGDFTFGTFRSVAMHVAFGERFVFIGDAAHAMSPHLGQGANLALEDAECLVDCLENSTDPATAFRAFHRIRRKRIRFYRQLTALLTPFFQSDGSWRAPLRDLALPWMPYLPWIGSQMLYTLSGTKRGWFR